MIEKMAEDNKLSQYITARYLKNIKKMLHQSPHLKMDHRDILHGLQTPLMRICHCNFPSEDTLELINIMVLRHCDVNIQDGDGRSLLSHACIAQNTDIIDLLSDAKICSCNPNIPDNEGNTALFYAVRSRNPVLVETLLNCFIQHPLDIHHKNSEGFTALDEAEMKCDREICHLLKRVSKINLTSQVKQIPSINTLKIRRSPTPDFDHTPDDRRPSRLPSEEVSPLVKLNQQDLKLKKRKKKRQVKQKLEQDTGNNDDGDVYEVNTARSNICDNTTRLTPRERKNSFSLPDLTVNSGSLVSSSPSSASGRSDYTAHPLEQTQTEYKPALDDAYSSDDDAEQVDIKESKSSRKLTRKASLSLPELRIDHVIPNSVLVEKKSGGVYITSVTPRRGPTNTPRSPAEDVIYNSLDFGNMMTSSPKVVSSMEKINVDWTKNSKNGLTLPQIDTTPRTGYPSPRSPRKSRVPYH